MKHVLVICDPETEYARRLMEFINRKKTRPLKAVAFDSYELAEKFINSTGPGVLLLSEKFLSEKVKGLKVMKTIILTEENNTDKKSQDRKNQDEKSPDKKNPDKKNTDKDNTDKKNTDEKNKTGEMNTGIKGMSAICKYFPGDVILREVESVYEAELRAVSGTVCRNHDVVVCGIYSPVGGSGKTSFALTLGQELARDHRVLYLNMESCSALETVLGVEKERNISDLVYYSRQDRRNIKECLSEMTVNIGNLDCIMPVTSFEDISCTKAAEWVDIIDRIASEGMYDFILVEPEGSLQGFINIMECCTTILVPYRADVISMAKTESFERMLKESGAADIADKTVKVKVPYFNIAGLGRNYYEGLIWSELGDCVRQLIRNENIA